MEVITLTASRHWLFSQFNCKGIRTYRNRMKLHCTEFQKQPWSADCIKCTSVCILLSHCPPQLKLFIDPENVNECFHYFHSILIIIINSGVSTHKYLHHNFRSNFCSLWLMLTFNTSLCSWTHTYHFCDLQNTVLVGRKSYSRNKIPCLEFYSYMLTVVVHTVHNYSNTQPSYLKGDKSANESHHNLV
jgi:hypothetical protein